MRPIASLVLCGLLIAVTPGLAFSARPGQDQPSPQKPTINLNTATVDQLTTLPGVGQKTAALIIEYRTKTGGFKKIEELMNIKGIGEKTFLKLKPLVSAPPKTDKTGA